MIAAADHRLALAEIPMVFRIKRMVEVWADPESSDSYRSALERYESALTRWVAADPTGRARARERLQLRRLRVLPAGTPEGLRVLTFHELGPEDLPRLRAEVGALLR